MSNTTAEYIPFTSLWSISLDKDNATETTLSDKFLVHASSPRPAVKAEYLSIPGMDGAIDLTEALGGVKYEQRTVTVWLIANPATTGEQIDTIIDQYAGRRVRLTNEDDEIQYRGRIEVVSDTHTAAQRKITLSMLADPFIYNPTAVAFTLTPAAAENKKLFKDDLTKMSGTLTAVDDTSNRTVTFTPTAKGGSAVFKIAVTPNANYSFSITAKGIKYKMQSADGSELNPANVNVADDYVTLTVEIISGWENYLAISQFKTATVLANGGDVATMPQFKNANSGYDVALLVNGKHILLPHTGEEWEDLPDAVIASGANRIAAVIVSDDVSAVTNKPVYLRWEIKSV